MSSPEENGERDEGILHRIVRETEGEKVVAKEVVKKRKPDKDSEEEEEKGRKFRKGGKEVLD